MESGEVRRKSKEQLKIIDGHVSNLDRMDKHADLIYNSLTHLLDLKQKHANAFEARCARDQAALQAKQGQTIMVFTIVTIVFLPMSFIAAVFAINVDEFPRDHGQQSLPWSYVAKFMFGIGFGISIPLILLAFAVDDVKTVFRKAPSSLLARIRGKKPTDKHDQTNHVPWARRYSESKYSQHEKMQNGDFRVSRSTIGRERELSPLSERSRRSHTPNRVSFAGAGYERSRLGV